MERYVVKNKKTNAMRILDREKVDYQMLSYDKKDDRIDGVSVAEKISRDPALVFKTLVAESASRQLYVFVIPVMEQLDLKKAAQVTGEKKLEMIPVKDIVLRTGYVRGGCSPLGMKKLYPTFIHESAEKIDRMIVSAGKIGSQIELTPADLCQVIEASYADITK